MGLSLPNLAAVVFAMCGKADMLVVAKKERKKSAPFWFKPKCATESRLLHRSGALRAHRGTLVNMKHRS